MFRSERCAAETGARLLDVSDTAEFAPELGLRRYFAKMSSENSKNKNMASLQYAEDGRFEITFDVLNWIGYGKTMEYQTLTLAPSCGSSRN